MTTFSASCHCGNLRAKAAITQPLASIVPRACDCDFCTRHGAAYLSDARGQLAFLINDSNQVMTYNQGSGAADFVLCRTCGVLMGVVYRHGGHCIGALNAHTLNQRDQLPAAQTASPQLLSDGDKMERWQQIWFQDVSFSDSDGTPIDLAGVLTR